MEVKGHTVKFETFSRTIDELKREKALSSERAAQVKELQRKLDYQQTENERLRTLRERDLSNFRDIFTFSLVCLSDSMEKAQMDSSAFKKLSSECIQLCASQTDDLTARNSRLSALAAALADQYSRSLGELTELELEREHERYIRRLTSADR